MLTIGELLGWLGPREAEAKIMGSPQAMQTIRGLMADNTAQRGAYLPDMYNRIYRAADAHPRTVYIRDIAGLRNSVAGAAAEYEPGREEIVYDAALSREQLGDVLPHELLHFLNAQSRRPQAVPVQHSLIERLLGRSVLTPAPPGLDFQPGYLTPQEHDIIRAWFQPAAVER